jgi:hypothetical protein
MSQYLYRKAVNWRQGMLMYVKKWHWVNESRKGELYLSDDVRGRIDKNRVPDGELIEW